MVKIRGMLLGILAAAIAVGFAAAMPGAMSVSEVEPQQDRIELLQAKTPKPERSKDKAPRDKTGDVESDEAGGQGSHEGDGHGAVVSTVAKCDVKGRWHGEAVRSIATNKNATLADAEAACEAATVAAAAATGPARSGEAKGKPAHASGQGKPPHASGGGKPAHAGPPAGKGKKP